MKVILITLSALLLLACSSNRYTQTTKEEIKTTDKIIIPEIIKESFTGSYKVAEASRIKFDSLFNEIKNLPNSDSIVFEAETDKSRVRYFPAINKIDLTVQPDTIVITDTVQIIKNEFTKEPSWFEENRLWIALIILLLIILTVAFKARVK